MADGTVSDTISNGCSEEFEDWLSSRLRKLGLDEDVFGSYVTGVLDSEETEEERKDALIGILEGMTVKKAEMFVNVLKKQFSFFFCKLKITVKLIN